VAPCEGSAVSGNVSRMAARLQTAAGGLLLDGEIQGDGRKALGLTVAAWKASTAPVACLRARRDPTCAAAAPRASRRLVDGKNGSGYRSSELYRAGSAWSTCRRSRERVSDSDGGRRRTRLTRGTDSLARQRVEGDASFDARPAF
jgi:hypothetical protein